MKVKQIISLAVASAFIITNAAATETREFSESSAQIVSETNTQTIYLADRRELADSLTGGVMTSELGGSLLTIDPTSISEEEKNLIEEAQELYILGGPSRIPAEFEESDNFTGRYAGYNRYETAARIGEELGIDRDIIIVNGINYVDAIASVPLASLEDRNVLLVSETEVPEPTRTYLEKYGQGKDFIFVGGEDSLPSDVKSQVLSIVGSEEDPQDLTIAGEDRYQTTLMLAKRAPKGSNVVMANGYDTEMALNSANLFDRAQAVLLANSENHEEILAEYSNSHTPALVYTIGKAEDWTIEADSPENTVEEESENNQGQDMAEEELSQEEPVQEEAPIEEVVHEEPVQVEAPVEEVQEEPSQETNFETAGEIIEAEPANPAQPFIDAALEMQGWAYSQSMRNAHGYADCSSLVNRALIKSGLSSDTRNLTSGSIFSDPRFYRISFDQLRPGDVLHSPGHLAIFMGDGQVFEAKSWGVPAGYGSYAYRGWNEAFRIKGL